MLFGTTFTYLWSKLRMIFSAPTTLSYFFSITDSNFVYVSSGRISYIQLLLYKLFDISDHLYHLQDL